jgi:hypothetical protein
MPPLFDTEDMMSFKATGSGFHFSGIDVNSDRLGADLYTLVGMACDCSTSVRDFAAEIEGCVKSSLEGCQRSPRVDNLLVRLSRFHGKVLEEHGYRPLADCHLGAYDGFLKPGGSTALYDASVDMVDSLATYGKSLTEKDYTVNGLIVVLTDGEDFGSTFKVNDVKESLKRALQGEALESLVSILIGINVQDPRLSQYLKDFQRDTGFGQYIEAKDASAKTFARVAGFISKSVSAQSQAVGSKGPSQPITF